MNIPRTRPALDWTRGHGIPFNRNQCPPDDEQTDVAAWLTARFDALTHDIRQHGQQAEGEG